MAVKGVGSNTNQNIIEQFAAQVKNLVGAGEKLIENTFGQNGLPETDSPAARELQQRGVQMRDRLESTFRSSAPVSADRFKTETTHNTGAIYRKVTTNQSANTFGLRSDGGTIPTVATDSKRFNFPNGDRSYKAMTDPALAGSQTGPLDRASIYMGGRGNVDKNNPKKGIEVDAGLAWKRTFKDVPGLTGPQAMWTTDPSGSSRGDQFAVQLKDNQYIVRDSKGKEVARGSQFKPRADGSVTIGDKTLRPNFAFRPFFRSSDKAATGDATKTAGYDKYALAGDKKTDREFYAGDKFSMSITVDPENHDKVTFAVRGVGADGKQIPTSKHSLEIDGFGTGKREFKRVDSVDQKGREGVDGRQYNKTTKTWVDGAGTYQGTGTVVSGGSWGATSVLKKDGATPFVGAEGTTQRSVEFKNDYDSIFGSEGKGRATRTDGSEQIYINPPNTHKPIVR